MHVPRLSSVRCSTGTSSLRLFAFAAVLSYFAQHFLMTGAQIQYTGNLSELRIEKLYNLAKSLENSLNPEKYACDNYYDYVCSINNPLFSILGHQPKTTELIQLQTELQNDPDQFEAKQKLFDFFVSCNTLRSLEDCYRETFEYFKPVYGYIITKNHINGASHEHRNFMSILHQFLGKLDRTENFQRNPIRYKLNDLKDRFRTPHLYFRASDLNREYRELRVYRDGFRHNLRNLEQYRKRNSTYQLGVQRTMLDWSLYLYQSRNMPMSYYYPTLNVHLWMTLYNTTERLLEPNRLQQIGECLKLPAFVNVLEEARILAVVYLKSFRKAWQDYRDWITDSTVNQQTFDQENAILKQYRLNNYRLFFTFYAQNFCDFGNELAENAFYLGLKENPEFFKVYSCGYQTERSQECL